MSEQINRRDFLKKIGFAAIAASPVASLLSSCSVKSERQPSLTILHTNDVHSRIDPFPADDPRYHGLGGYARRKKLIDNTRLKKGENNVLVFESGDMFQGTPYFNFYKGMAEMSLMNQMHVDAVTIGNHEFDNGVQALCDCMEKANFPFINSNYEISDERARSLVLPYKIFERAGLRIGVFGLGVKLAGLVGPRNCQGFTYRDPILTAIETASLLRKKGCCFVIALSHIGYSMVNQVDDVALAKSNADIDVIIGGHTHTFLPQPVIINNALGRSVIVNQVGFGGINVGQLEFSFLENSKFNLASAHNKIIGG